MTLGAAAALLVLGVTDIYPELRPLLGHEFFTFREGIGLLLAQHREKFGEHVLEDLRAPATDRRTRIGLPKVVGGYEAFPPSTQLYRAVEKRLASDDAIERSFAVEALRKWLTCEGKGWKTLQGEIRRRLDALRKTEPDPYVKGLLD